MEYCKKNQEEQMKEFMKNYVTVQKYKDVEEQLNKLGQKEEKKEGRENNEKQEESGNPNAE